MLIHADAGRDLAFVATVCCPALLFAAVLGGGVAAPPLWRRIRRARLTRRVTLPIARWQCARRADRSWRAAEREQAAEDRERHARVMAGYWRSVLLATQWDIGGDPRGALLATQWDIGHAIAARLDAATETTERTEGAARTI